MEDKVICNKSDLVNADDAIRSKLGVTDTYYVSELSSAIQSIETGGIVPSGTISITENGTVDVTQYASAEVNVSSTPSLQSKSVTYTENGTATITPDEGYDGLSSVDVMVNVASGGGSGAGLKVTFPATATNWGEVDPSCAFILLADGTIKSVKDYSTIGGKTIENVAGIQIKSAIDRFVLRMTLSAGGIAQFNSEQGIDITSPNFVVTTAPNATPTPYNRGRLIFWWPVADTVISSIEMYNTD